MPDAVDGRRKPQRQPRDDASIGAVGDIAHFALDHGDCGWIERLPKIDADKIIPLAGNVFLFSHVHNAPPVYFIAASINSELKKLSFVSTNSHMYSCRHCHSPINFRSLASHSGSMRGH